MADLGQQFAANPGRVVLGAIYSTGGKDQLTPMGSFPPHKDVDAFVNNCSANDVTDMANIANADTATESKPNDARANEGKLNEGIAKASGKQRGRKKKHTNQSGAAAMEDQDVNQPENAPEDPWWIILPSMEDR